MSIVNIIKEPEYYYPAGMAEQDGLMTYQESQKLDSIPTPSNIVTKSSTAGLLKNDGTVDTNSYVKKSDIELEKTATGNPITLTDAVAGNAIEVSAEIVAVQDLHGYDKPWVGGAGKNKLPNTLTSGSDGGITYAVDSEGIITVSGSASGVVEKTIGTVYLTAGTYKLNGGEYPTSNVRIQLKDSGGNVVALSYNNDDASFTVSTAGNYTAWLTITPVTISGSTTLKPMIRLASVADATFAPYENICPISGFSTVTITDVDSESHTATVTVSLGSTVYGGTLNLTTGELTITHGEVDLGSLSWVYGAVDTSHPYGYFYTTGIVDKKAGQTNFISSAYTIGNDFLHDKTILGNANNFAVYVIDSAYNDATTFKTAISGYKIVYELATPTTTTLTAAQLALVKGQNTLTCNSGDMSITYKTSGLDALKERVDDLEDAVEDIETDMASKAENSVVGTVENGTTASKAYAIGEHFIRNDKFCTAIAAIANGATLTLNTNYVEGTIAEALNGASGGGGFNPTFLMTAFTSVNDATPYDANNYMSSYIFTSAELNAVKACNSILVKFIQKDANNNYLEWADYHVFLDEINNVWSCRETIDTSGSPTESGVRMWVTFQPSQINISIMLSNTSYTKNAGKSYGVKIYKLS